jgi:hypothetical protein
MTPTGAIITARRSGERGSAALELAIGVIGWALALAVLATAYQVQAGGDDVSDAAAQAARAAALTATAHDAAAVARATAQDRLATGTCEHGSVRVSADVAAFRAGGTVAVTVSCRTDPPLGPTRTLSSTGEEPIDRYRGGL